MHNYHTIAASLYKLIIVITLACTLTISGHQAVNAATKKDTTSSGYSVLKLFLEDQQYLTLIRRTQMIISFEGISERSQKLIDDISTSSEKDLDELERLAREKPAISFAEFSDDEIGKATFDSLRMTTAKEFFFEPDDFEKNILLSQLKVLRVISHLAKQLELKESNSRRKKWLSSAADRYEEYYQQINKRITLSAKHRS